MALRKIPILDEVSNRIYSDKLGSGSPDNTKFLRGDQIWSAPIKIEQIFGGVINPSTNSAVWADLPDMVISAETAGYPIIFQFWSPIALNKSGTGYWLFLTVNIDGIDEDPFGNGVGVYSRNPLTINTYGNTAFYYVKKNIPSGSHIFKVRWKVAGSVTATARENNRIFSVMELVGI